MSDIAAGATPGPGAILGAQYPSGPVWAAYRLPGPGANGFVTPREVGIGLDGEPGDGATPPAGSGDPAPQPKPQPQDPPKPPATGVEPDADGMTTDAGREALKREREARRQAERERDELRAKTQTDSEKHDAEVKAATTSERDAFWQGRIRASEVRSALRAKGLTEDKALNLAANAPEFAELTVGEDGQVAGLTAAVDKFATDYPTLFAAPKGSGQPTRGPQNGAGKADQPKTLGDAVAARYSAART